MFVLEFVIRGLTLIVTCHGDLCTYNNCVLWWKYFSFTSAWVLLTMSKISKIKMRGTISKRQPHRESLPTPLGLEPDQSHVTYDVTFTRTNLPKPISSVLMSRHVYWWLQDGSTQWMSTSINTRTPRWTRPSTCSRNIRNGRSSGRKSSFCRCGGRRRHRNAKRCFKSKLVSILTSLCNH